MWTRSDYILGTERRRFGMVVIRGVRKYSLEHLVLWDRLLIYPNKAGHQCNIGVTPAQMVTGSGVRKETRRYHM